MDWSNAIFGGITLASVMAAIIASRSGAAKDLIEAATGLVEPLRKRVADLEDRLRVMEVRALAFEQWAYALAQQVRDLGFEPVPFERYADGLTYAGALPLTAVGPAAR